MTGKFYKWEVVALLWVAYFLNQGDRQIFNTVLPHIQEPIGASDVTMGLISTCFNVFFACTVPFAGYFADRMSRKRIIVFSVALFAVVLAFRLKDRPASSVAAVQEDKPSFFEALGAIFKVPTAVCMIAGFTSLIFVLTGYLTWMPKYLMTQFGLGSASAGLHSMLWTHAAAFVGVLVAGSLSDLVAVKMGPRNRLLYIVIC